MTLFRPGAGKRLRRAWEFTAPAPIWRIYPSGGGRLVVECRDAGLKKASFLSLDEESGRPLWSGRQFVDPWWVGVEAVYGETLFLHGFASPDMPLHAGIYAFGLESGMEIWSRPDLVFECIRGGKVVGSVGSYGTRTFSELSPDTGEVAKTWEEAGGRTSLLPDEAIADGERHPVLIAAGVSGLPSHWQSVLQQKDITGPIEHIDQGKFTIFSFTVQTKKQTEQWLYVWRRDEVIEAYSDILSSGTNLFIPDSFVVLGERLFYVKFNLKLVAVDLRRGNEQ